MSGSIALRDRRTRRARRELGRHPGFPVGFAARSCRDQYVPCLVSRLYACRVAAQLLFAQAEPDVADWLQGWGTVAGAVFSALAFLATLGLLLHEIRVRRRDEEDPMAQQARLITTITRAEDGKEESPLVSPRLPTTAPLQPSTSLLRRNKSDSGPRWATVST
jgi:hypothetical protein